MALRSASLAIALFGTATNSAIAFRVLAAWQQLKWGDVESEWAGDSWPQAVDGVNIMWALLSLYFVSAAVVSTLGFVGILRNKPSLVRLYRDYSIADFSFCALSVFSAGYAAFLSSARAGICEEFSHHPELMRDMHELGLSSENCEYWLERAMFVMIGVMAVVLVIRLHFLLAVSNFYSQLTRQHSRCPSNCCSSLSHLPTHINSTSSGAPQRIFLVPFGTTMDPNVEMVYTPVPRSSLPGDVQTTAKEVWVSLPDYRHRHHRHRSRETGKIRLPVRPDEGLLPPYRASESIKAQH